MSFDRTEPAIAWGQHHQHRDRGDRPVISPILSPRPPILAKEP